MKFLLYLGACLGFVLGFTCPHARLQAASNVVPVLAAEAGRIVFYRDAILSPQKRPALLLNDSAVGLSKSRSFFYVDRPAGNYAVAIAGETAMPVNVALAKGKTVYVRINVHSSPVSSELYPSLVDNVTAARELTSCTYAPPEAATALGAEDEASAAHPPLRVLLAYQGHATDQEKFFALWEAWQKQGLLTYTRCPLPDEAARLEPTSTAQYDVLVLFDVVLELTPEQQAGLLALLNQGIGVVSLHQNLAAHEPESFWRAIVGGEFLRAAETIDGKAYTASTLQPETWLHIGLANPKHPIVRGIEPFYILDEGFEKTYRAPDIKVVLTTDTTGNDREIAWTKWFANSPIFYYQLGHEPYTWTHPVYQKVLWQGMRWVAAEASARRESAK